MEQFLIDWIDKKFFEIRFLSRVAPVLAITDCMQKINLIWNISLGWMNSIFYWLRLNRYRRCSNQFFFSNLVCTPCNAIQSNSINVEIVHRRKFNKFWRDYDETRFEACLRSRYGNGKFRASHYACFVSTSTFANHMTRHSCCTDSSNERIYVG